MAEKLKGPKGQVRIRILPLRGIGGVGVAGDEAWMDKAQAEQYVKDGYVEIIEATVDEVPSSVPSTPPAEPEDKKNKRRNKKKDEKGEGVETQQPSLPIEGVQAPAADHAIMPPENKRE